MKELLPVKVTGVVVSMGARLGMGGTPMTVPWDNVQVGRDQQSLVVTLQRPVFPSAPARQDKGGKGPDTPSASPSTGSPPPQPQQK